MISFPPIRICVATLLFPKAIPNLPFSFGFKNHQFDLLLLSAYPIKEVLVGFACIGCFRGGCTVAGCFFPCPCRVTGCSSSCATTFCLGSHCLCGADVCCRRCLFDAVASRKSLSMSSLPMRLTWIPRVGSWLAAGGCWHAVVAAVGSSSRCGCRCASTKLSKFTFCTSMVKLVW
eukprot:SAG11_NODE_4491_length_1875_cov_7.186937_3_plen_175_part_00